MLLKELNDRRNAEEEGPSSSQSRWWERQGEEYRQGDCSTYFRSGWMYCYHDGWVLLFYHRRLADEIQRHSITIMQNSSQRIFRSTLSESDLLVMIIELTFSVIAAVGGDGTFYEVLNGLANRSDAKKALRIPLAPIPTGKLAQPLHDPTDH